MPGLSILIPIALLLGFSGLVAFFWAMKAGQYEDLDGAAMRILIEDEGDGVESPDDGAGAGKPNL
ncbi:cbb3-type cytochrome oxidase assembly protein CcoS [Pseudonocardia sp. TMWB2A]|uniref:cbb3-type cytochrome oxidase assembly protein CcoS n=1 Tax=Pseudonocardia sp. TMWB2A TaxID=687430 RepID=UPI00307F2807